MSEKRAGKIELKITVVDLFGPTMAKILAQAKEMIREDRRRHPIRWAVRDFTVWLDNRLERLGAAMRRAR